MNPMILVSALIAALITVAPTFAQPASDGPAPRTGSMSPAAARAYLQAEGVDLSPQNLPQQIMGGKAKAVDAMIAAGVDVNAKTSLPQSPLELAATSCSNPSVQPTATAQIIDSLVAAGADPNAAGIQGLGPLMIASQQCGGLVVERLVRAGARLDSRTTQGFTPLTMALVTKHYDAADVLIQAGARLTRDAANKLTEGSNDKMLLDAVRRATSGG